MALTRTSLTAAIGPSDLTLAVTSTTGFPTVGAIGLRQMMQVDDEYMLIEVVPVANTVKVLQRGYNGTAGTAHDVLAPVATSSVYSDFANIPTGADVSRPPDVDDVQSVGQNGIIPVPVRNTTYLLTKATALGTTTFAAPGKDQDGLTVTFTSQTAAAHVITATTLWGDAVSGSPHTTATFAAFIGASLMVKADNGIWNIVSAVGVTIT